MPLTVYADVLLVVNYCINLLILFACARLLSAAVSRGRLCLAALLGAVGSLVIFLPYVGGWFQFLYKLLLTLAITATAFGLHNRRRFCKGLLAIMAVSFCVAGLMMGVSMISPENTMLYYNGVVYFNVSAVRLVLWTASAYGLLWLLERLFATRVPERKLCRLHIRMNGSRISLMGFFDTGNRLQEPFSGAPVILCDPVYIQRLGDIPPERRRIIPCQTVSGSAALEGFRPEEVCLELEGRSVLVSDVYVAVSREPLCGEYQALLNPQLLSLLENNEKACMKP